MRNVDIAGFARSPFTLANKGVIALGHPLGATGARIRAAFMRLMRTGGTLARIEHLLVTGKPLRN